MPLEPGNRAVTAPAVRRPLTPKQVAALAFTVTVLLCMVCVPASREWMWLKFADITLSMLGWLGADIGPLTN